MASIMSIAKPCGLKVQTSRRSVCARAEGIAKVDRSKDFLFFPSEQSLTYLDGTNAGDFGFDPLGLSDPEGAGGFIDPEWLRYGEIINGRWAMLGVAGMIAPEILGNAGVIPEATRILWFKTGVIPPAGQTDVFGIDAYALFWIEVVLMQFAELRRWQDYKNPGSMGKQFFLGFENVLGGSGDPAYPGGPVFNFAGFGKDEASMKKLRTNEIRNGRLAMLSVLGYGAQAVITGKGPWQNVVDHVSDPFNNNILTNLGHIYGN